MLKAHSTFELESYSIVKEHEAPKLFVSTSPIQGEEPLWVFLAYIFQAGALYCSHSRKLVELLGFEPRTSALQRPRSPN